MVGHCDVSGVFVGGLGFPPQPKSSQHHTNTRLFSLGSSRFFWFGPSTCRAYLTVWQSHSTGVSPAMEDFLKTIIKVSEVKVVFLGSFLERETKRALHGLWQDLARSITHISIHTIITPTNLLWYRKAGGEKSNIFALILLPFCVFRVASFTSSAPPVENVLPPQPFASVH